MMGTDTNPCRVLQLECMMGTDTNPCRVLQLECMMGTVCLDMGDLEGAQMYLEQVVEKTNWQAKQGIRCKNPKP